MHTARMKTFTILYNSDLSEDIILISKQPEISKKLNVLYVSGKGLRKMIYELILVDELDLIHQFSVGRSREITNEDGENINVTFTTDFTGVVEFSSVEEDIRIPVSAEELRSFFVERMRDELVTLLENATEKDIVDYYRLKEKKIYTLPSLKTGENKED